MYNRQKEVIHKKSEVYMDEKLLTVQEVADQVGFSLETIRRYIKRGINGKRLPAIRMGREYRIRPSDLREFLAQLIRAA